MTASKNSSVYTLTSPYVTSKNYEVCSLKKPIHEKIKHSDFSKTWAISDLRASDVVKTQVKWLNHKTWNSAILEFF